MERIVIDATGMVLGRMANRVAKLALQGNQVAIINCENAMISGKKDVILNKWKTRMARVQPFKGPFIPRMADRIVKSVIRGMLPHGFWSEKYRGRIALSRVKCYLGVPTELKSLKIEKISGADIRDVKTKHALTVGELARLLRG